MEIMSISGPFFIMMILLFLVAVLGIMIATYVMKSLAFYKIAEKRDISNPWLAWLPFGRTWIVGRVCDEYDERTNVKKNWAIKLLILEVLVALCYGGAMHNYFEMMEKLGYAISYGYQIYFSAFFSLIVLIIPAIFKQALGLLKVIAEFKVYESIVPKKSFRYTLLSLVIPMASGICMIKTKSALLEQMANEAQKEAQGATAMDAEIVAEESCEREAVLDLSKECENGAETVEAQEETVE